MTEAFTTAKALTALDKGERLQVVARDTGLSREKVRWLGEKHGFTPQHAEDERTADHVELVRRISARVCEQIESGDSPLTLTDIYDEFSQYARSAVHSAINDGELFPLLAANEVPDKVEWSEEDILAALRHAESQLEKGERLTGEVYDGMVKEQWVVGPSRSLIIQRFGSWSTACSKAGVAHDKRIRRGTTAEDFWPWLHRYAEDQMLVNHSLSFGEYSKWAKSQYGAPSGSLLKARMFLQVPWYTVRNQLIHDLLEDHPDRWVRETRVEALT